MKIDRTRAKQAGYTDAEIDAFEAQLSQAPTNQFSAKNVPTPVSDSLSNIPFTGGPFNPIASLFGKAVAPLTGQIEKLGGLTFGAEGRLIDRLTGKSSSQGITAPEAYAPGISQATPQEIGGQFVQQVPKATAAGVALTLPAGKGFGALARTGAIRGGAAGYSQEEGLTPGPATALGAGAGAILEPALAFLTSGMLTKKGAANKTTVGAEKATAEGKSINWDDLQSKAKEAVTKKYGHNP